MSLEKLFFNTLNTGTFQLNLKNGLKNILLSAIHWWIGLYRITPKTLLTPFTNKPEVLRVFLQKAWNHARLEKTEDIILPNTTLWDMNLSTILKVLKQPFQNTL